MTLTCPQCGAVITPDNINIERLVAMCAACGEVFSFEDQVEARKAKHDQLDSDTGEVIKRKRTPEREIPLPAGMQMSDNTYDLVITRSWRTLAVYPLLFFTMFWDGFMLLWYTIALTSGAGQMALFGLLHLGVGVYLTYTVLTGLFNITTIEVDANEVSVTHGPVPVLAWVSPTITLEVNAIEQLYVKERVNTSSRSVSRRYEVVAITAGNRTQNLITNLSEPEQAHYIVQQIERFLQIADMPVALEHQLYGR